MVLLQIIHEQVLVIGGEVDFGIRVILVCVRRRRE